MTRGAVAGSLRPLLAVFCAATLAAGCTLRRPEAVSVDWAARQGRVLALEAWQFQARIAVKASRGSGQGDLRWEQQGAASRVRVSGPFGAGAYDIHWDPATLSIASRNGEFSRAYSGPDAAEEFLTEQLGWSFPAASARFWLLGVPDPASPAAQQFRADGQLAMIEQGGWSVTYDRFADHSGLQMPAKIGIEGARARVRVVIDRWDF